MTIAERIVFAFLGAIPASEEAGNKNLAAAGGLLEPESSDPGFSSCTLI